jgi:hypothetical protein
MQTKTINLYLFTELNEEQKNKVIENYQDINVDYDQWSGYILEDWVEKLARQGFEDANIQYSGFWSQGDGASFSASVNLEQFLKGRRIATKYAKELKDEQEDGQGIAITTGGLYSHEYMMSIDSNLSAELEAFILEEARDQARKIYKDLQSDYESLTSPEQIADTLKANEYLFNEETLRIDHV